MHDLSIVSIRSIIGVIPKNKKMILFSSWNGQKYADSSMYMFEYFLKEKEYQVYWYTKNKKLYNDLIIKGIPVVYSNSINGIWKQIRANMLVSSIQMADFSPYFLNSCIYFDLGHGFPIKQSGFEQPDATPRSIQYTMLLRQKIDYYMVSASRFESNLISRCFCVQKDHIVKCNKPRMDIFFDESMREGKNEVVDKIKASKKAIVYMPTHRSCGKVPIEISKIFNLDELDNICEENDAVFIVKKHFFHRKEKENLDKYRNIFDITNEDIETQTLLLQADVLISDYSACYIDYLILDKPIILYAYDYESFIKNERDLYFKFEDNDAGFKAFTKEQFNKCLISVVTDWQDVEHATGREHVRNIYFDTEVLVQDTRKLIKEKMEKMLAGTYELEWKEEEK